MKIHLVTVVADFHYPLTLGPMLLHYQDWVDWIELVFYVTEGKDREEEEAKFRKWLDNFLQDRPELGSKILINPVVGSKYDWDFVTTNYNEIITKEILKGDWFIIADSDELQVWPENPRDVIQRAEEQGKTFITGAFLDRIGPEGIFSEINSLDLDKLFPLVGFFRHPLSGACPNKVVAVKADQRVTSGQHYALFEDGSNSWGFKDPRMFKEFRVQVHHFKWDLSILKRLKETARSGCNYGDEYLRMYKAVQKSGGKIDISNPDFMIEEYNSALGFDSFTQWRKVCRITEKI